MKRLAKMAVAILTGALILGVAQNSTTGKNEQQTTTNNQVKIEKIYTQDSEDFRISEGEVGIVFTDGSWASINEEKEHYEFQQVNMGDWSLEFETLEEVQNCISNYLGEENETLSFSQSGYVQRIVELNY